MYKEVTRLLKKQDTRISENYLRLRIESHPDYPSVLAVKDTLDELNIPCHAYETDKTHLQQAGKPFLAHLNKGEGQLLYFNSISEAETKIKDFDKYWNGVALLASKPEKAGNAEHDAYYKKEKKNNAFITIAVTGFLASFIGLASWQYSAAALLLFVANAIGLYFSWLIAQKELGLSNAVSDKICSLATHSRCEAVLFSRGAKLTQWLSWGDIGITYFVVSFLFLALSLVSGGSMEFYFWLSLAALVFPLYSLYYQWQIVKQWCMLCIGVLAALALNAVISISFLSVAASAGTLIFSAAAFIIIAVLICCGWQIIKELVQKSTLAFTNKIDYIRMKRNPDIFNGLLVKEQINPVNLPQHDEAIRFGRPDAPVQIVMACNPYCGPCAKAHQAIEELYEKHPTKIATTIRFTINSLEETDFKTKAAILILKSVLENKAGALQILKDWYASMNYESFVQKYNPNGAAVTGILEQYKNWSAEANISGTPTLFINGRKLPGQYNWKEFIEIIEFEMQN